MLNGANKTLTQQVTILQHILKLDNELFQIIGAISKLAIANGYIAGGSITQSVWNYIFNQPIGYGFSDVDIVYFDKDISETKERKTTKEILAAIPNEKYRVDVKNEARVHLWYQNKFGVTIKPYQSTEDAISTWPSTASSLGVYLDQTDHLQVFAPYGLNDLFTGIVAPNKKLISENIYQNKADKWQSKWPDLTIIAW